MRTSDKHTEPDMSLRLIRLGSDIRNRSVRRKSAHAAAACAGLKAVKDTRMCKEDAPHRDQACLNAASIP